MCQKFRLKPEPVSEADIDRMHKLHWIWQQEWEKKYDEHGADTMNVNDDHWLGDLWDWETYAEREFQDVLPQYPSLTCLAVAVVPFMLMWGRS